MLLFMSPVCAVMRPFHIFIHYGSSVSGLSPSSLKSSFGIRFSISESVLEDTLLDEDAAATKSLQLRFCTVTCVCWEPFSSLSFLANTRAAAFLQYSSRLFMKYVIEDAAASEEEDVGGLVIADVKGVEMCGQQRGKRRLGAQKRRRAPGARAGRGMWPASPPLAHDTEAEARH